MPKSLEELAKEAQQAAREFTTQWNRIQGELPKGFKLENPEFFIRETIGGRTYLITSSVKISHHGG